MLVEASGYGSDEEASIANEQGTCLSVHMFFLFWIFIYCRLRHALDSPMRGLCRPGLFRHPARDRGDVHHAARQVRFFSRRVRDPCPPIGS